jgi:Protein of unknown function (DUF3489)
MKPMTKLTPPQLALLTAAAAADDGATDSEREPKTIAALIKKGFLISIPQTEGPSRLLITGDGREAVSADRAGQEEPSPEAPAASLPDDATTSAAPEATSDGAATPAEAGSGRPAAPDPKPKGKIASLVELLRQPDGTTVGAMMAATGWQAHSVRGAISGAVKKKLGLSVLSARVGDIRVYRIVAGVSA